MPQFLEVLEVLGDAKALGAHRGLTETVAEAAGHIRRAGHRSAIGEEVHLLLTEAFALPPDDRRRPILHGKAVEAALPVAHQLARRFRDRGEPLDDLTQVASLALVHAVGRYDPTRESGFLPFAVPTILGELRRHFRDHTWAVHVPRSLHDLRLAVTGAESDLIQVLQRQPTSADIADYLGVSSQDVGRARATHSAYRPASLDLPMSEDGDLHLALRSIMATLSEPERRLISMRFVEQLSQADIGARIGVSQMQVSRLLTAVLGRLRAALNADSPIPATGS
jgi:RNA polymerase sigma-B factor